MFDVGAIYHGTPKASLNANIPSSSPLNLDPALKAEFDTNLAQELTAFRDDIASFKFHPVVSIGIGYRF
jgi:hypothetical protein